MYAREVNGGFPAGAFPGTGVQAGPPVWFTRRRGDAKEGGGAEVRGTQRRVGGCVLNSWLRGP